MVNVMKSKQPNFFNSLRSISPVWFFLASLCCSTGVYADTANGVMVMNIDQNAIMSLHGGSSAVGSRYWYIEDYFDASYNNALIDGESPNPTPGYDPLSTTNDLRFVVNGPTIAPAPASVSRLLQPTTFNYTGDPTKGTGKIGFSGAFRTRSDSWKGYLLCKEMTLEFDPARVGRGGNSYDPSVGGSGGHGESGWVIKTNEDYFGTQALFDLVNVNASTSNGALRLTGDLILSMEWGTLLSVTDGQRVGSVSLEPTGFSNTPSTPAKTDNVLLDTNAGTVDIQDVQVQGQHFRIRLQLQPNNLLGLAAYQLLPAQAHSQPAVYDITSQNLTIPVVRAYGKSYRTLLHNTGNFQFRLDQAIEN